MKTAGESLKLLIQHHMQFVNAFPHFPAKVVVQNADLSVDVAPDSNFLPSMQALPLRMPAPGVVLKVQPGSRVQVVFENGDRAGPVAVPIWDQDAGETLELEIHATVKASVVSPDVRLGSTAAVEQLLLGTTFRAAHATWHGALALFLTGAGAFGAVVAAACSDTASALTAMANDPGVSWQAPTKNLINTAAGSMGAVAGASTTFTTLCGATVNALLTVFEGAAATYLSNTSKTL